PVEHIDIVPTILDATSIAADPTLPGVSLRQAIERRGDVARRNYFEALSFNLTRGWAPLRGLLAGTTKYIDLPIAELYDLAADPQERQNMAPSQSARVQSLADALRTFNAEAPTRPSNEPANVTAALRSLGYLPGIAAARQ